MPAHRRPGRRHRAVVVTSVAAALLVVGGAITTSIVLSGPAATANASSASPARAIVTTPPPPASDRPASDSPIVDVAPLATSAASEPPDAFAQIMGMAGYPTDPDTAAFLDTTVTSICADLAAGRTGLDILADTAARTTARGWSDDQSDGVVYIGVASRCSAYSYLLP